MLLEIRHTTRYEYELPGSLSVQRLRLTPTNSRGQTVLDWSVETPGIEQAATYTDGFGNVVHLVTQVEPHGELTVTARGRVDVVDTGGVVGDLGEPAKPAVFLRATPLTETSGAIDDFATNLLQPDTLSRLHALMEGIARRVAYETDSTHAGTTAAQAFEACSGVCQDHAHIFIAGARRLGAPARYVTGYLHLESSGTAVAHHAWAEAWVEGLGWVGFDPANGICPTERYVRLACGFDAPSAAPITGVRRGGVGKSLTVHVSVLDQQQQ